MMDDLEKVYKVRGPKPKVTREEMRDIILDYAKEKKTKNESFYLTNTVISELTGVTSHLMLMRIRTEIPLMIDGIIPELDINNKMRGKALFVSLSHEDYQNYQFTGKNFRFLTNDEVVSITHRVKNFNSFIETRLLYRILVICDAFIQKSPLNIPQPYSLRNISEMLLEDQNSTAMLLNIMQQANVVYIAPDERQYCLQNIRGKKYDPSAFTLFSSGGKNSLKGYLNTFLEKESNQELKHIVERLKNFAYKGKSSEINLAAMLLYVLLEREDLYSPTINRDKEEHLQHLKSENSLLKQQIVKLEEVAKKVTKLEDDSNVLETISDEYKELQKKYNALIMEYNKTKVIAENFEEMKNKLIVGVNNRLQLLSKNILKETDKFKEHNDEMLLRMNCVARVTDIQHSFNALIKTISNSTSERNLNNDQSNKEGE